MIRIGANYCGNIDKENKLDMSHVDMSQVDSSWYNRDSTLQVESR